MSTATDLTEYVQAASMRTGSPVHIVREYGEGMRVVTECGRHLFWPSFVDEPGEPSLCLTCKRATA